MLGPNIDAPPTDRRLRAVYDAMFEALQLHGSDHLSWSYGPGPGQAQLRVRNGDWQLNAHVSDDLDAYHLTIEEISGDVYLSRTWAVPTDLFEDALRSEIVSRIYWVGEYVDDMKLICDYLRDHVLRPGEKIASAWADRGTDSTDSLPETGFLVELMHGLTTIQLPVLPTEDHSWVFGHPRIVGGDLDKRAFDDLIRRLAGRHNNYFFDLGASLRRRLTKINKSTAEGSS